jgi:mono/diheme cytochrome c family protein
MARLPLSLLLCVFCILRHAVAQQPATANAKPPLDVTQLFATTCGWCHSDGGRAAGKGPQLMNTQRTDDFIRTRIKLGKEGAMPAFGSSFTEADIDAIIRYIRALKPEQG